MQGRIALVTGAASGIGAEVSKQLVTAGANVVLMDIDSDAGQSLADQIGACFVHCDVGDVDSWHGAVAECRDRLGPPDFAHLNAGVMSVGAGEAFLPIDEVPLASYRRIVNVNLDGVVFGLRALMPLMRERGGAITVTSSIAGLIGLPIDPFYAATKGPLEKPIMHSACSTGPVARRRLAGNGQPHCQESQRRHRLRRTRPAGAFRARHSVVAHLGNTPGITCGTRLATTRAGSSECVRGYSRCPKHALVGLVRSVAQSMDDAPLRINAICPGAVDTPIVPDALKNGAVDIMPVDVLAREVLDLLSNGGQGEVRVRLKETAFRVDQHAFS